LSTDQKVGGSSPSESTNNSNAFSVLGVPIHAQGHSPGSQDVSLDQKACEQVIRWSADVRRKNSRTGSVFYGVLATKYGSIVLKDTTHLAVAIFGQSKMEKINEMEIPRPYSKTTIALGKDSK